MFRAFSFYGAKWCGGCVIINSDMNSQNNRTRIHIYCAAFLIPVLMLCVVYALHGIYPFGDNTVMTGDAKYQFVDYLSYLKSIVFGNNDFNYSFSKNLGGNMRGFSAYYYMSMLNFITLMFPSEFIPAAQALVLAVTAGLCSLNFCIFISSLYEVRFANLIFSIAYAFMGFMAAYFQLSMYFTCLAILPLIILGLFRLVSDSGHFVLYMITLFVAVLSNYYMGFMICIFCLLMFVYKILLEIEHAADIKKFGKTILTFICSSLLAVGMSAFNLLPALLSLEDEKNNFSLGIYRTFPLSQIFSKLYVGSFKGNLSMGLPNIYCGIFAAFLLVMYLLNGKISKKERILSAIFISFLIINLNFNPLNVIWHGLNQPIGFPYRYSYLLSFLFIYLSYRGFTEYDENREKIKIISIYTIFVLYSVFLIAVKNETVGIREIIITAAALTIYAVLFTLLNKKTENVQRILACILVISAAELSFNIYDAMDNLELSSLSEYREYVNEMGETVNELKQEDSGFYRVEKDVRRTHNDAMQFDYAGLSHFSSSEKKDKMAFLGKLGLRNNGNWAFYAEPSTMFLDCFLGVKHFISQFHTTPNNYTKIIADNTYKGYLNEDALPIIFAGDSEINNIDYRNFGENPFEFQQAVADSLLGRETGIFVPAEVVNVNMVNLVEIDEGTHKHYEKTDESSDGYINYSVKVEDIMNNSENPANLFAYFDAPGFQNVTLYRYDTDMGPYFDVYRWNIVNLETHTVGDTYEISLHPAADSMDISGVYFYYENRDAVREFSKNILSNPGSLNKVTSSHLQGNIYIGSNDQCAVLSIPYDEAWSIKVDGKRIKPQIAAGMLLSFDAGAGDHEIDMRYIPKGAYAGLLLSIIAVSISFCIIYKKKH